MTKVSFTIPGVPRGKERPRVAPGHSRPYTPAETVRAEREIRQLFRELFPDHRPFVGPVVIRFVAIFPIPESWPNKVKIAAREGRIRHITTPDKDNIEKLILDALNPDEKTGEPLAWFNDGQVVGGGVKRYGSPARTDVTIELIEQAHDEKTPAQMRLERDIAEKGMRGVIDEMIAAKAARKKSSKMRSEARKAAMPSDADIAKAARAGFARKRRR